MKRLELADGCIIKIANEVCNCCKRTNLGCSCGMPGGCKNCSSDKSKYTDLAYKDNPFLNFLKKRKT